MFTAFFVFLEGGLELFDLLALLDTLLLKWLALKIMLITAALGVTWPLRIELFVLAHGSYGAWRHLQWLCFLLLTTITNFLLCAEVIIPECKLDSNFGFTLTRFANGLSTFDWHGIRLHGFHGLDRIIFLHYLGYFECFAFLLFQLLVIY